MLAMLLASAIATATPVSMTADPAAQIAHALTPRENLRAMILMTLDRGGVVEPLAARVGAPRADALLSDAAENSAYDHAGEWETALAAAYRETLTPAELTALLAAIRSDDLDALAPVGAKVGAAFFRRAAPLLQTATNEARRAAEARLQ